MSDKEYNIIVSTKDGIQNNSYLNNGATEANLTYRAIKSGENIIELTNLSGNAQAVFIKNNTYKQEDVDYNAVFTIESIGLEKTVSSKKFELPEDAKSVNANGIYDGVKRNNTVSLDAIDDFADSYSNAYDMFDRMASKSAGEVTKFYGDYSVVYKPSETGKGTVTSDFGGVDRTAAAEFVKTEGYINVTLTYNEDEYVLTIYNDDKDNIDVTKNGVAGYKVTILKTEEDGSYVAQLFNPSGNFVIVQKDANGAYSLIASDGACENNDLVFGYYK